MKDKFLYPFFLEFLEVVLSCILNTNVIEFWTNETRRVGSKFMQTFGMQSTGLFGRSATGRLWVINGSSESMYWEQKIRDSKLD